MSLLYINESSAKIGMESNRCTVKYTDGAVKEIPVSYYSVGGNYYGKLQSTGHVNTQRQRKQCSLYDSKFALELSKRIISAKLKNQAVVLRRYERSRGISVEEALKQIDICRGKVQRCRKLDKKLQTEVKYLKYADFAVSFRQGIAMQMERLVQSIDEEDSSVYEPVEIR